MKSLQINEISSKIKKILGKSEENRRIWTCRLSWPGIRHKLIDKSSEMPCNNAAKVLSRRRLLNSFPTGGTKSGKAFKYLGLQLP